MSDVPYEADLVDQERDDNEEPLELDLEAPAEDAAEQHMVVDLDEDDEYRP